MTSPVSAVEAIEKAMRDHIKVDATGLSPAVASAYVVGFDEAAKAVSEIVARQAEALKRENAELREALRPFAECAPEWEGEPDSLHVFFEWNDESAPVPSLPVADFRRARTFLKEEANAGN